MPIAGSGTSARQRQLKIPGDISFFHTGIAGDCKLQPAVLSPRFLKGVPDHITVKALHPLFRKEVRAIDNPVTFVGLTDLQRFDPHVKTVDRNALLDRRFYLFPDSFHRA